MSWSCYNQVVNGEITIDKKKLQDEINLLDQPESNHPLWITIGDNHGIEYDETITEDIIFYEIFRVGFITTDEDTLKVIDNGDTMTFIYDNTQFNSEDGVFVIDEDENEITDFIGNIVTKPTEIYVTEEVEDSRDGYYGNALTLYFGYTEDNLKTILCNKAIDKMYNRLHGLMNSDTNEIVSYVSEYLSTKLEQAA